MSKERGFMSFNLHKYQMSKQSADLPNGQTTIDLPNGQGAGQNPMGVQLTDGQGNSMFGGEADTGDELKTVIGDILYKGQDEFRNQNEIQQLAQKMRDTQIPSELTSNTNLVSTVQALGNRANELPSKVSVNPATGQKEHTLVELASQIANMAGWYTELLISEAKQKENSSSDQNLGTTPTVVTAKKRTPVETTREEEYKEKQKEDPAKKRKKGNPFKVLMGLVGKMLDHGMVRREIVKKVLRQEGNKWKPETIEKCIKIVSKGRKKEKQKKQEKKSMTTFNLHKYAQKKEPESRKSIYDIPRTVKLMSTMELVSRLAYLIGAASFDAGAQNENKPGTKDLNIGQVKKDLNTVKAELKRRNYSKEQVDILTNTVQGIRKD